MQAKSIKETLRSDVCLNCMKWMSVRYGMGGGGTLYNKHRYRLCL